MPCKGPLVVAAILPLSPRPEAAEKHSTTDEYSHGQGFLVSAGSQLRTVLQVARLSRDGTICQPNLVTKQYDPLLCCEVDPA